MRKTSFSLAMVFAILLVSASPAPAFYWSLKAIPTLTTPIPPLPGADPLPLPPDTPVPHEPGGPSSVPEPATAAAGVVGLLLLGARRILGKK